MEIKKFKKLDSTHKYLIKNIKNSSLTPPIAIICDSQSAGIGSRGNVWKSLEGNLFLSFALNIKDLPKDLPQSAFSIYFSYILKLTLEELGSKVWVKWPNDFYIEKLKIGGTISFLQKNVVIGSIGLNLSSIPPTFGALDIEISRDELLENYLKKLAQKIPWKQIFSKFSVEFHFNRDFSFNCGGGQKSLDNATLLYDGSISIDGKKVYNLR